MFPGAVAEWAGLKVACHLRAGWEWHAACKEVLSEIVLHVWIHILFFKSQETPSHL